jgi:cytochrome c553
MSARIALSHHGLQLEARKMGSVRDVRSSLGLPAKALCAALSVPSLAWAQTLDTAALAASCMACHGPQGISAGAIPSIRGLDASSMAAKLRGFRKGEIDATVMTRIAKGYTVEELDVLARYFAALKP